MEEAFSNEVDVTLLTPSRFETVFSIGSVTCSRISLGEAPG